MEPFQETAIADVPKATKPRRTRRKAVAAPAVESIVNDAPKFHHTFEPGDVTMQGDLIIVALSKLPPTRSSRNSLQLADGSSKGSRHVLRAGTKVYDCGMMGVVNLIWEATEAKGHPIDVDMEFIGPVWVAPENPTENDLTHPEHGNQGFPTGTILAVVFQRNLDLKQKAQRAYD